MAKEFTAKIDAWVKKTKSRRDNVVKSSIQELIIRMNQSNKLGGNMPVKTGFLRSSLRVSIGTPTTGLISRPSDYNYPDREDTTYTLTIAGMPIGETIYAVYIASYAAAREYGTANSPGSGFRRLAVQQWQSIVDEQTRLAREQFR